MDPLCYGYLSEEWLAANEDNYDVRNRINMDRAPVTGDDGKALPRINQYSPAAAKLKKYVPLSAGFRRTLRMHGHTAWTTHTHVLTFGVMGLVSKRTRADLLALLGENKRTSEIFGTRRPISYTRPCSPMRAFSTLISCAHRHTRIPLPRPMPVCNGIQGYDAPNKPKKMYRLKAKCNALYYACEWMQDLCSLLINYKKK